MLDRTTLPEKPGCYLFKNSRGDVIYVGKAKSLKKRVASYFTKNDLDAKTANLVQSIADMDYIITDTELEALILENNLIKKHVPHYNINLKDSRRYAGIEITDEPFPRILIARNRNVQGKYFGPFGSAQDRDGIIKLLNRTLKLRTCKKLPRRACIRFHIGICTAPCIGNISNQGYADLVSKAELILKGNTSEVLKSLEAEMANRSKAREYERALELRDQIHAIGGLYERQKMERSKVYNEDIINYLVRDGCVYLAIFKIYKGTLSEKSEFSFDFQEGFLEQFLVQYYSDNEVPRELILPELPDPSIIQFLSFRRSKQSPAKVTIPKVGEKKQLLDLVRTNIESSFLGDRIKMESLQKALQLNDLPNVIECFDISHLSGTSMVGSMVQFRNSRPDKSNYRRFRIRTVKEIDDFAAIAEVVRRRYSRLKAENAPLPDLIIIDGGVGQLHAAMNELRLLEARIPVISIAKKQEEVFVPFWPGPLPLKKEDKASRFIQEIRDEAHRFAIAYHKVLRSKAFKE